jgi:hypothetical protein
MKKIFTLLVIVMAGFTANAQYYYLGSAGQFTGSLNQDAAYPTGGGQVAGWTSLVGPSAATPVWSAVQTLPFPFDFNGSPVTNYKISSTGVLTFTTAAVAVPSATPAALPSASIPDKSICMWGLNANGSNDNGSIKVFGTAPNRQLWVHYSSCTNATVAWSYWSIVLVEGSNKIYIVDQRNASAGGALSAGIQIDATTAVSIAGSPALAGIATTDFTPADDYNYEFIQGVQPANEIALLSCDVLPYVGAGPVTITGTVKNYGSNPITSFAAAWDNGSGPQTGTISGVTVAPSGGTASFSHTITMTAVAGSNYTINLGVTLPGDADLTNNVASATTTCLSSIPARTTVGEEKTGTWCGWCPRGAVGLAGMEATSSFIGIAVHNGDPMTITSYDGQIGTYVPGGYPGGGVDRVLEGDPSTFASMHAARVTDLTPCAVNNVTFTNTGTNITVSAQAEFFGTIAGNYRMSLVMVEDDVIGGTTGNWLQTNYYSGGGNGVLTDPVSNFVWSSAAASVNPTDFGGYDHVARTLSSDNMLGTPGSLPAGSVPIGTHNYTFAAIPTSTFLDLRKTHAVVMIVNATTGEVMNAGKSTSIATVGLEEIESVANYSVYPNPSAGSVNIAFNLLNKANVSVQITDALGNVVYTSASSLMSAGEQNASFNGANLADGMYFVNLNVDGQVSTKRLTMVH